ncbi:MAG TPA: nucleotide exchange factor GrpE [Thermoanaerobaculia bacterium]|nr:nucleotide exchange factor GrpE [Thermoanaerobaculia bacterium]
MARGNGNDSKSDETGEVYEIEIDDEVTDADEAMRQAMKAVEARERGAGGEDTDAEAGAGSGADRSRGDASVEDAAEEMEHELEELRERSIRTLADYENFRRRVERERADHRRYASAEALTGFLTVVDNLERALRAEGSADDLREGVEMIHRQMLDLLERFGASPVAALGERFDPSVHEAVARLEDESVTAPTVLEEYQRGYRMHDRLLRPAMVRVGIPRSRSSAASDETAETPTSSDEPPGDET